MIAARSVKTTGLVRCYIFRQEVEVTRTQEVDPVQLYARLLWLKGFRKLVLKEIGRLSNADRQLADVDEEISRIGSQLYALGQKHK
jgi:hypothetical protein